MKLRLKLNRKNAIAFNRSGIFLIVILLLTSSFSLPAQPNTLSDLPNNSRATAMTISLPAGAAVEIRGRIDRADSAGGESFDATDFGLDAGVDDIEWFGRFTLDAPDLIEASLLISASDADLDLYLLRQDGRLIQSSALAGVNPEQWSPGISLAAGDYFVGISNIDLSPPSPATDFVLTLIRGGRRQLLAIDNGLPIARYFATSSGRFALNRLTPLKYPFRLTRAQIFFGRANQSEPNPSGQMVRLVVFLDEAGGASPPPLSSATLVLDRTVVVQSTGAFNGFDLGAAVPLITRGVVYVGFQVPGNLQPRTLSIWADSFGIGSGQSFTSEDGGISWKVIPIHSFLIRAEGTILAADQ